MNPASTALDELKALERHARELDTGTEELARWLDAVSRFSIEYLQRNATGPAWIERPEQPLAPITPPRQPVPLEHVLRELRVLLERNLVPTSGRFFGYVPGGGLPSAAVGDFLAALTNRYSGVHAASPGAAEVENSAIRWLIEMVGYPDGAWGTLQSGGTLATLTAIVAARETRPPAEWGRGVIYQTEECHQAARKSLHIAGLGHLPVRTIPVDGELRMSAPDLARAIEEDRRQGLRPWMVFASAGTVNTGAIDPLDTIAGIAAREASWLHVDAAYGGFFILTHRARPRLTGMAKADSIVLDPHKGLFLPYGCGAVLVKEGARLRQGFAFRSSYLEDVQRDEVQSPADYSPELTRHFRGLRLWMSLALHGLDRFGAALEEKLLLAELAQERLEAMPSIETGPRPQLSCVAFRVRSEEDERTEKLHRRLLDRGRVYLSSTRLGGRFYLRICILCFRSHVDDLNEALDEIERGIAAG